MRYPLSDEDQYSGKIRFISVSDPTVDLKNVKTYINSFQESWSGFSSDAQAAADEFAGGDVVGGEFGGLGLTPPRSPKPQQRSTKSYDFSNAVTLYLPQGINIGDGVEYERFDFGTIGTLMSEAVSRGNSIPKALADAAMNEGQNAINMLAGGFSGMSKEIASLAAVRVAQRAPGSTIGAVARSATGVTTNPNTKTLFKAVNLRTFSFSFKMIASSAAEAQEINSIVNHFRREMYPELIQVDNLPLGYIFPNRFNIDITYNGYKVPIKFLESNLLSMNTTYNPSSMGYHEDGMPSEVDMTLSFGEPRTLSKSDFNPGGALS